MPQGVPAPKFDQVEVTSGNRVMVMMAQQSFAPGFHWDRFADGSFALAEGPEYDIRVVGADGVERFRIHTVRNRGRVLMDRQSVGVHE